MPPSLVHLVTGGAGFIGSHLVRALLHRGELVRVLDDLSGPKDWRRLEGLDVERVHASIHDEQALDRSLAGVGTVFHHAALVSVPESVADPLAYHQVDATATLRLLEAVRRLGVQRVVYASTSAIYGDDPEQPKRETMRGNPKSPYGIAKYAGELYVSAYASLYGLQTVCLRYFNVFGPGQDPRSQYGAAVPNIVSRVLAGESPIVYGDGEQTRDFCHVDNVIHANLLAADASHLQGEVVNVGCGQRVSINHVVELTNHLLGRQVQPTHLPPRPGDVRDSLADVSLAAAVLGYRPVVHFGEGLRRSIDWYARHWNRTR